MSCDPASPTARFTDMAAIRHDVHQALENFFADRLREARSIDPLIESVTHTARSYVLGGGKRIRPLFAWAGYLGATTHPGACGEQRDAVITAVSSLELIQACALIHDDIIDDSDTRRGQPTMHRLMEQLHREHAWDGVAGRFGVNVAILLGDMALTWADDMLNESGLSSAARRRVQAPWRAMRTEVIAGQILDIAVEAARDERIESAKKIIRYKTSAYTIERPLDMGAAIADAAPEIIDFYRRFGSAIGQAFQLRDDMLGVFGDPTVTGKPAGDDLREGKHTVLLSRALSHLDVSDPASAALLRAKVGHTNDPEELTHLAELIASTPAVADVEAMIEKLTTTALDDLERAPITEEGRALIALLAHKATDRRS